MVPFNGRVLRVGRRGKDVAAVQRRLHQLGIRQAPRTGYYGWGTWRQVRTFQRRRGLEITGRYNRATHERMAPGFDSMSNYLYRQAKPAVSVRDKIVSTAMYGYRNRSVIHYSQGSMRMRDFAPPPNVPNYTDCSAFATWCYKSAGAPDPNGLGYNGYGYTGTMIGRGTRVTLAQARPGDLVFYGRSPTVSGISHVAVYVGGGKVVSHGQEAGPSLLYVDYRSDRQAINSYAVG